VKHTKHDKRSTAIDTDAGPAPRRSGHPRSTLTARRDTSLQHQDIIVSCILTIFVLFSKFSYLVKRLYIL